MMRAILKSSVIVAMATVMLIASRAGAADGRLELSQDMMPITIASAGSYVLTENLTGQNGSHGITILCGDVVLDLNGYHLEGVAGSLDGITVPLPRLNLTVRNGTISAWGSNGVAMLSSTNCVIADLRVFDNGADGVNAGFGSLVTHCLLAYNGDGIPGTELGDGIEVENSSVVRDCVVIDNDEHGIDAHSGTVVENCVLIDNLHDGIHGSKSITVYGCIAAGNDEGLEVDRASRIEQCVVRASLEDGYRNIAGGCRFVQCTAFANGDDGIDIDTADMVTDCIAYSNVQEGIETSSSGNVTISRNVSSENGDDGIKTDGHGSRIDGNLMIQNGGDEIKVSQTNNIVIRNVANQYDVNPTNHFETVSDPGAATVTDPWINFDL